LLLQTLNKYCQHHGLKFCLGVAPRLESWTQCQTSGLYFGLMTLRLEVAAQMDLLDVLPHMHPAVDRDG